MGRGKNVVLTLAVGSECAPQNAYYSNVEQKINHQDFPPPKHLTLAGNISVLLEPSSSTVTIRMMLHLDSDTEFRHNYY